MAAIKGDRGKAGYNNHGMDDAGKQPPSSPAEHLRPYCFQPGQSGNPSGRPKGARSISAVIRRLLDDGVDGKDICEILARSGVNRAAKGDFRFWKEIVDRTDGKIPDVVLGDGVLKVIVEYDRGPNQAADAARGPATGD